jgi:hypothetical protein
MEFYLHRPPQTFVTHASQLLRDGPPLHPASLLSPSRFQPLGVLAPDNQPQATIAPLAGRPIGVQVHTFRTRAQAKLAPPLCRTPSGQSAGTRQTHPGTAKNPRFRRHLFPFDTSSAVYSRSPSWLAPGALTARLFPRRSPPRSLDRSSSGRFAASACTTTAEATQPYRPGSSISCTAPHPAAWSSTSSLLQRSCSHLCAESAHGLEGRC